MEEENFDQADLDLYSRAGYLGVSPYMLGRMTMLVTGIPTTIVLAVVPFVLRPSTPVFIGLIVCNFLITCLLARYVALRYVLKYIRRNTNVDY